MTLEEIQQEIEDLIPSNMARFINAVKMRQILNDLASFVVEKATSVTPVTFTNAPNGTEYVHGIQSDSLICIFIKPDGQQDYNVQGFNHTDLNPKRIVIQTSGYNFTGKMYIIDLNPLTLGEMEVSGEVKWEKKTTFASITGLTDKTIYEVAVDETNDDLKTFYYSDGEQLFESVTIPVV